MNYFYPRSTSKSHSAFQDENLHPNLSAHSWVSLAKQASAEPRRLPLAERLEHQSSLACLLKCTTWTLDIHDITDEENQVHLAQLVSVSSLSCTHRQTRASSSSTALRQTKSTSSKSWPSLSFRVRPTTLTAAKVSPRRTFSTWRAPR